MTGNIGFLDFAPIWTDVTSIDHFNHAIFGNTLDTAQVKSFLRINGNVVDTGGGPSITTVEFTETSNDGSCTDQPGGNAPLNPLGTNCDDFAFVSGLDLSPVQLTPTTGVKFRLDAAASSGALVCPGAGAPGGQPAACGNYDGSGGILIYTAEDATNHFSIQAQLFEGKIPLFVIGDCEYVQAPPGQAKKNPIPATENNLREVNDVVNFWGSQWWKNNCMSLFVDNGYPAFKGFATNVDLNTHTTAAPCGLWQARPGNSGHPPDQSVIGNPIAIIVTDNVIKDGPNIGGNIKQIVLVDRAQPPGLDNYDGNPGHQGWGTITQVTCGQDPGQVP